MREMLITKPDIGLHKTFFSVLRMHQGFTGRIFAISFRILSFAEKIMGKYSGVRSYDFDFSSFVFLDRLMAESGQEEQAQRRADEIQKALTVWNVFGQHMHLSVWNSTDQAYHRVMNLINRYGSFYPQFFAGDVQVQGKTSVLDRYNTTPYVVSRTFRNVVWHLQSGNQIEPAGERIKHDFERQMLFFNYVQEIQHPYVMPYSLVLTGLYAGRHEGEDRPAYHLSTQRILHLKQSLENIIGERHTMSATDVQEHQISELKDYVEIIAGKNIETLTAWEVQLVLQAETFVETMALKQAYEDVEAAVGIFLKPEWQEQLSITRQRILNVDKALSDIIYEKQMMHMLLQHMDTEFEHLDSATIWDQWEYFKENAHSETTQINKLFSLQRYIETVSRKPQILITNEDIDNVAIVEDTISQLENNLIYRVWADSDIAEAVRAIRERHFESSEEEKAFFIDSIKNYSTAIRQNQNTEKIIDNFIKYADLETLVAVVQRYSPQGWQEFKEKISRGQDLNKIDESVVFDDIAEIIQMTGHQVNLETVDEIYGKSVQSVDGHLESIIQERKAMASLFEYLDVQTKQHSFESYEEEKALFVDIVRDYGVTYGLSDTLVFRVRQYTLQEWQEFKENISHARAHEEYLTDLKKYIKSTIRQTESEDRKQWNVIDGIFEQQQRILQNGQVPVVDVRKILSSLNIDNFSVWVNDLEELVKRHELVSAAVRKYEEFASIHKDEDFETYKNYFIQCMDECRKEKRQLFLADRSRRQIERVFQSTEGRRIHRLLNINELPRETVEFESIHETMLDSIRRYDRAQWNKLIADIDGYYNTSASSVFETAKNSVPILRSAANVQSAFSDIMKIVHNVGGLHNINTVIYDNGDSNETLQTVTQILRTYAPDFYAREAVLPYGESNVYLQNQNMVKQILSEQTVVFLENLRELVRQQSEIIQSVEKDNPQLTVTQVLSGQGRWASQANADAYRKVQRNLHVVTDIQGQRSPVYQQDVQTDQEQQSSIYQQDVQMNQEMRSPAYQQNVQMNQEQQSPIYRQNVQISQEQQKPQASALTNYLAQNQPDAISYETLSRMVLREEMADSSGLTPDADSAFRSGTRQDMVQLAPSVKQGKEKLRRQELELERMNIALMENKTKVEELTKEQLKLIQLIQEQGKVIEQIGTNGTIERMMMNRLQNEMRIERLRRGIR